MKYVIIGGVAGGATAAARLRRIDEQAEIVLLEKGKYISYANCGLPYYIGGVIEERGKLLVQTPESFGQRFRIDVRVENEVVAIDTERKTLAIRKAGGEEYEETYDKLLLSPGATPVKPPLEGIHSEGIFTLRNVEDTDLIKSYIADNQVKRAVVVGAGFIGLEMAENLHHAGISVSVVEMGNHRLLNGRRFGTLFIDEAAQALEAACWIAIRKADRVVLAGDHCQLPPTIKCYEAARGGLERTLMEKVAANKPSAVSLLKVQYRMHEDIMRFSSNWFYDGELEAAPEIRHRGILDWDTPVTWIDTSDMDFKEEFVGETFGRINKEEAHLLLKELEAYILRIGGSRILEERIDFGLISPYKAQVQYLRGKIKGSATLRPYRSLITVNTVDGFQGQERDVIFISLVRANEEGQIGFLNDLRRMNVAITRARMKLVILGEAATLGHHAFYKQLLEYVKKVNGRQ